MATSIYSKFLRERSAGSERTSDFHRKMQVSERFARAAEQKLQLIEVAIQQFRKPKKRLLQGITLYVADNTINGGCGFFRNMGQSRTQKEGFK